MIFALIGLLGCGTPCDESGQACAVAGTGVAGFGAPGVHPTETDLYWPADITLDPDGRLWIVDWNNHRIARVDGEGRDAVFVNVSGGGFPGDGPLDGAVSTARWNHPTNLTFRDDGLVVIAAWHNSMVIGFDMEADQVVHLAGNASRTFSGDDGPALEAGFDLPSGVAYGPDGRLYITDQANQRVRCIDEQGVITTVVGNGEQGYGEVGPALEASLNMEVSQNADPGGRIAFDGHLMYLADTLNQVVRVIDTDTWTLDTLMGNRNYEDEGTAPEDIGLFWPRDVAVGPDGAVYVADTQNHCVRVLRDGVVSTVLGVCGEEGTDGEQGLATEMHLELPLGIDVGPDGTVYVADTWNHRILAVAP